MTIVASNETPFPIAFSTTILSADDREAIRIDAVRNAEMIGLAAEEWDRRRAAASDPFTADRHMAFDPDGETADTIAQREALKARHAAADAARG